ncbi:uncharacterized protein LOC127262949 [Andrographis paniculata]|uniref:uncharacterized protein LOC127262949 n=1 Tax=Andrographis paniculata TaxID=175694 RepID=UPI0021E7961B|nr:uncharacterized protein LOC127262949 [Andrographis paniculata]
MRPCGYVYTNAGRAPTMRHPGPELPFQQPLLGEPSSSSQPKPPEYVVELPTYPAPHQHLLLRKPCRRCLFCLAVLLIYVVAGGYLLWPSDPELSVVRLRLDRLRFHTDPKVSVDATVDLTVRVRNRDFYSMDYDSLVVAVEYRGERLGFVTSDGGRIERRRSSYVNATLQLDGVAILTDAYWLIEDLERGAVTLETVSEITGKLGVLVFDLPLKTKMQCEVSVDTESRKIHRQSCYPEITPST